MQTQLLPKQRDGPPNNWLNDANGLDETGLVAKPHLRTEKGVPDGVAVGG